MSVHLLEVVYGGGPKQAKQGLRGCRQSNLVQIAMARIWQMAR